VQAGMNQKQAVELPLQRFRWAAGSLTRAGLGCAVMPFFGVPCGRGLAAPKRPARQRPPEPARRRPRSGSAWPRRVGLGRRAARGLRLPGPGATRANDWPPYRRTAQRRNFRCGSPTTRISGSRPSHGGPPRRRARHGPGRGHRAVTRRPGP
jgi:hypothetical protein